MPQFIKHLALAWGLVKGATVAVATAAIGIAFWQSVVVATISGVLGATGAILGATVAARMATREAKHNRAVLHDIQGKVGANQRTRDEADRFAE